MTLQSLGGILTRLATGTIKEILENEEPAQCLRPAERKQLIRARKELIMSAKRVNAVAKAMRSSKYS